MITYTLVPSMHVFDNLEKWKCVFKIKQLLLSCCATNVKTGCVTQVDNCSAALKKFEATNR